MCSVDDDDPLDGAFSTRNEVATNEEDVLCKKCRVAKSVLSLQVNDRYCKGCFLNLCTHKFRATLGKHKVMLPGDRVAIGFSGSQSSLALLSFVSGDIMRSEELAARRPLLFHSNIIIVDESGAISSEDDDKRRDSGLELIKQARSFPFPVFVCPLEYVLMEDELTTGHVQEMTGDIDGYNLPDKGLTMKLQALLAGTGEPSAKEFLLHQLKHKVLVAAAKVLGFTKLFTAESTTSLAVSLLSGIAIGRGSQLSMDTGFLDMRHKPLQIIRPVREFSKKELILYNSFQGSNGTAVAPSITTKQEPLSIVGLTEDFILGLQDNFPSTIPTIFRTGDKLITTTESLAELDEKSCILCHGLVDTLQTERPCSLQSTHFSQLVSSWGPNVLTPEKLCVDSLVRMTLEQGETEKEPCGKGASVSGTSNCGGDGLCTEGGGGCGSGQKGGSVENREMLDRSILTQFLCYSCRLSVAKMETIPDFLAAEAMKQSRRQKMKNEIQNFLL